MKRELYLKAIKILARKGGNATLKKYGKKHYRDMIKKRWAKVAPILRKNYRPSWKGIHKK